MKIVLLAAMLFFHIIDDYKLQGWLAQAKQKKWWEENAPEKLYKKDYVIALIEHAFSWACSIHIPVLIYSFLFQDYKIWAVYFIAFIANWIVHGIVDHLKANKLVINLVQDQSIHALQIFVTWFVYVIG